MEKPARLSFIVDGAFGQSKERAMKTFNISKTVIYVLLVAALTVSIPMVVAYGQKKVPTAPGAITIDTYQMMAGAKNLPVLQVDEPY
jgi:hypothetical protein